MAMSSDLHLDSTIMETRSCVIKDTRNKLLTCLTIKAEDQSVRNNIYLNRGQLVQVKEAAEQAIAEFDQRFKAEMAAYEAMKREVV